jgi:hypothetical protein
MLAHHRITTAIVTAVSGVVLILLGSVLFVYSGVYDVSSSSKDNPIVAWTLHKAYEASLHRHGGADVPPADLMSFNLFGSDSPRLAA